MKVSLFSKVDDFEYFLNKTIITEKHYELESDNEATSYVTEHPDVNFRVFQHLIEMCQLQI